jgi:preprotein translocase subunit SecG
MYTLIIVLIFIVCILLTLIVLVQNSKGGGLASNFQSSNQIMGVRKTTDFLEKATWVLGRSTVVPVHYGIGLHSTRGMIEERSRVQDQIENAVDPTQIPTFPNSSG